MEKTSPRRDRLAPWYIGISIIILTESYVGYKVWNDSCSQAFLPVLALLIVLPVVYLTLMYLTFTSQK